VRVPSKSALRSVADWLDECTVCGVAHSYRQVYSGVEVPGALHTWADPVDGHAYTRRVYALTQDGRGPNDLPAALRRAAEG
jgi:hypothetical protein